MTGEQLADWTRRPIGRDDHPAHESSGQEYCSAEEPRDIALQLIATDPQRLHVNVPLVNVDFAFRYRRAARRHLLGQFDLDEKTVQGFLKDEKSYAETRLVRGRERYFSAGRVDVLIWIWADMWVRSSEHWKRYVVDHELAHIGVEVIPVLSLLTGELSAAGCRPEVTLLDHDMRADFAAMWVRHGIPGDVARALYVAKEAFQPLPPLPGADTFAPPSLASPQLGLPHLSSRPGEH
jgi:hypothetical protein